MILAPLSSSSRTDAIWPLSAALISGVASSCVASREHLPGGERTRHTHTPRPTTSPAATRACAAKLVVGSCSAVLPKPRVRFNVGSPRAAQQAVPLPGHAYNCQTNIVGDLQLGAAAQQQRSCVCVPAQRRSETRHSAARRRYASSRQWTQSTGLVCCAGLHRVRPVSGPWARVSRPNAHVVRPLERRALVQQPLCLGRVANPSGLEQGASASAACHDLLGVATGVRHGAMSGEFLWSKNLLCHCDESSWPFGTCPGVRSSVAALLGSGTRVPGVISLSGEPGGRRGAVLQNVYDCGKY